MLIIKKCSLSYSSSACGLFSRQSSKLSFHLSTQVYYLLGQTEEERKAFFGGSNKGDCIVRLPPRALGCHKRWKGLFFCDIWSNPNPPFCLLDPLTNKHCRVWSFMINLWIDSRTSEKYTILLLPKGKGLKINLVWRFCHFFCNWRNKI